MSKDRPVVSYESVSLKLHERAYMSLELQHKKSSIKLKISLFTFVFYAMTLQSGCQILQLICSSGTHFRNVQKWDLDELGVSNYSKDNNGIALSPVRHTKNCTKPTQWTV